jgi:AraC family transcriptional regulator of arabinose operon
VVQPVGDYFLAGKGEWLDSWWKNNLPTKTKIGFDDTVITLWKHIISEKKKVMQNQEEIMDYLLRTLCLTLEQVIQSKQRTKGADIAHKLKLFIESHANEPLSLEKISASVRLSVSRSSYMFKAALANRCSPTVLTLKLAQQQVLYSNDLDIPPGEYRRKFGYGFIPY